MDALHQGARPDGATKARCHYCGGLYVINPKSTGNLWRHVKDTHSEHANDHKLVRLTGGASGSSQIPPYSYATFREGLVRWIVARDQPLCLADSPALRWLFQHPNPSAWVPSARALRRDIRTRFGREKARVRSVLQGVPGRPSFAVDAWTSRNMHAFLGITAHWVDAEWLPRHVLLDTPPLLGRRWRATAWPSRPRARRWSGCSRAARTWSSQVWVAERGLCARVHVPEELGEAGALTAVPPWPVRRLPAASWPRLSINARP
jgi:hypothetical protein